MKVLFQEKSFDRLNYPLELRVVLANYAVIIQERSVNGDWEECQDDELTIRILKLALLETLG